MSTQTSTRYGGWFTDQSQSTGSSLTPNKLVHWAAATLLVVGTGGAIDSYFYQRQHSNRNSPMILKIPNATSISTRKPAEDLERVREIFALSMSDLARAFDVSRQAVYNWTHGEQQPKPEHITKLQDFAQAADIVAESGVPVKGTQLKRKLVGGKNLFEIGQSGGSVRDAAQLLIQLIRHEAAQREHMTARFAGRKRTSRSVESEFPAENDIK